MPLANCEGFDQDYAALWGAAIANLQIFDLGLTIIRRVVNTIGWPEGRVQEGICENGSLRLPLSACLP